MAKPTIRPIAVITLVLGLGATIQSSQTSTMAQGENVQAQATFELRLAYRQAAPGLIPKPVGNSADHLYIDPSPIVASRDVVGARMLETDGGFNIVLSFSSEAGARMSKATAGHVGKPLAIVLNGQVLSAPVLTGTLSDSAMISGSFTRKEAEDLVAQFSATARKNRSEGSLLCRLFAWC